MSDISTLLARAEEISSDAERVTEAKLRKVRLPGGAGVIGLITLDNGEDHTKPNTFGPRGLISLNTAIDAALADDEVTALAVTGKPFIFAAGAVMVAVFFTFALSGPLPPKEMGIVLGVAVLLDAFLVRLVLLPVMLRLTGKAAWWSPAWLRRVLPTITFSHG